MRFVIVIAVDYDEITVPDDMEKQLEDNAERCIQNAELLDDSDLKVRVDDYWVEVKRSDYG